MIFCEIVVTTSPPAISAPEVSKIAAMINAPVRVRARDPTAGPTLLATSLAPMLSAIYPPSMDATTIITALDCASA